MLYKILSIFMAVMQNHGNCQKSWHLHCPKSQYLWWSWFYDFLAALIITNTDYLHNWEQCFVSTSYYKMVLSISNQRGYGVGCPTAKISLGLLFPSIPTGNKHCMLILYFIITWICLQVTAYNQIHVVISFNIDKIAVYLPGIYKLLIIL